LDNHLLIFLARAAFTTSTCSSKGYVTTESAPTAPTTFPQASTTTQIVTATAPPNSGSSSQEIATACKWILVLLALFHLRALLPKVGLYSYTLCKSDNLFLITRHIALATSVELSPAIFTTRSTTTVPAAKSSNTQSNDGSGLSRGEMIGIIVGILSAILAAVGVCVAWKTLKVQKAASQRAQHGTELRNRIDMDTNPISPWSRGHGYT
jgi:hypothetical protein